MPKCLVLFFVLFPLTVPPSFATAPPTEPALPVEELQRFTAALENIRKFYVEPVKETILFDDAIRGMLANLDPHSAFLDPEELSELRASTSGEFEGLGLEVTQENGHIRIISPIDDTPAQKAGLRPGDTILQINETPTKGLSLKQAVELMRGPDGSKLTLQILRQEEPQPLSIEIFRKMIRLSSVRAQLLRPEFLYIRISHFQARTAEEVQKHLLYAIRNSKKGQLQGVVLDLRNNPGGMLVSCVKTANLFLDSKHISFDQLIVYTKGRLSGAEIEEKATGKDLLKKTPIVVLINRGSASAAEILAGALQDHKRAIVIGENSFGKGSVQTVLSLPGRYGIKLTTALYYTPSGRSIQAKGIQPDLYIPEQFSSLSSSPISTIREAQLDRHLASSQQGNSLEVTGEPDWFEGDFLLKQGFHILKSIQILSPSLH